MTASQYAKGFAASAWTWQNELKKCGISEDLKFKPEAEIAFELIQEAISNRAQFGCVGRNTFYGRQTSTRRCARNTIRGIL